MCRNPTDFYVLILYSTVLCCASSLSCVWLFSTSWTVAGQASLSMGILQVRALEWVAMTSFRGSPDTGTEPRSPALQADSLPSELPGKPCYSATLLNLFIRSKILCVCVILRISYMLDYGICEQRWFCFISNLHSFYLFLLADCSG